MSIVSKGIILHVKSVQTGSNIWGLSSTYPSKICTRPLSLITLRSVWTWVIVSHALGDHANCSIYWCKYLKDPVSYQHSTLLHGKDLEGEDLKKDFQHTIEIYCRNAEKLAPLGSSQANEALNNTIGSKAPKQAAWIKWEQRPLCSMCSEPKEYWPFICEWGM